MARKALSDEQIEHMRKCFCDTAYELYRSADYDAVTMRAIAKSIGCSPMMAYRYFENKEEVFAQLRARLFHQLADALEAAPRGDTPLDHLESMGKAYIDYAQDNPDAYRLLYMVPLKNGTHSEETDRAQKRTSKSLLDATQRVIAAGQLHGDPVVLAHSLWASIHGLISLHLSNQLTQGASFKQLVPQVLQRLIHQHTPAN